MSTLHEEIEQKSKEIITDNYSMSVGELISMYKEGDLDIHPEFQRYFRWSDSQKSRLIESFLLNFPVPPIFVYQRTDGVWDIVDGLQRVSTILQFAGKYKNEDGKEMEPLVLEGTKLLPSMAGKKYIDDDPARDFGDAERRYFKKARLGVIILKKESDETGQYEVFQRLNTGGTSLSPQEVRNCLMVMTNRELFKKIKEMSEYKYFVDALPLNDKAIEERMDMEIATRFICLRHEDPDYFKKIDDFSDYLNDKIISLFKDEKIDWELEKRIFEKTFDVIYETMQDEAFCRYFIEENKFKGGFYVPAFEFVAVSIGRHDGYVDKTHLKERIIKIWQKIKDDKMSWQGRNHRKRISETLALGNLLYED